MGNALPIQIVQTASGQSASLFSVNWSRFVFLLPSEANIHVREYKLYLPSKEELRRKLEEWAQELGDE